jgi:hypothetical protein
MSEGTAIWLFYGLPLLAFSFLPTLIALCWRRDRLLTTFAVNMSVVFVGPIGTILALIVVAMPKEVLDRILERIHARKVGNQPRAWLERECPACRQWIDRTSSACLYCHARVEPLDQECPACKKAMPLTASTCLSCGYDQTAKQPDSRKVGSAEHTNAAR